jgi:hypothetical protein
MSDYNRLVKTDSLALAANFAANVANATIADVAQLVHRQQAVIRDLSVTVSVLAQMLVDAGVVDLAALTTRVEREIAEQREASQRVKCTECGNQVPIAKTDIRASGPVCDACIANGR